MVIGYIMFSFERPLWVYKRFSLVTLQRKQYIIYEAITVLLAEVASPVDGIPKGFVKGKYSLLYFFRTFGKQTYGFL